MQLSKSQGILVGAMATALSLGFAPATLANEMLQQLETVSGNPMSQVRGVAELSDVSPNDWAYAALSDLVQRYNCIAGYPNGTFRGDRPLSRYEFAAGLNACLQQIERLIAESTANFVSRDDLETVKKLMAEFEAELAMLTTRVDNLDSRVAFLEDNQFSTTTQLRGNVFMHMSHAWTGRDLLAEGANAFNPATPRRDGNNIPIRRTITDDSKPTFSYLTWLNFSTSFTGKDNLAIQLAAGNGVAPANTYVSAGLFNTWGTTFTNQDTPNNSVILRELFYQFPVNDRLQLVVGPRVNWYRYFDGNRYTSPFQGADSFNSSGGALVNTLDRGAGAVALARWNDKIQFNIGYLGESTEFLSQAAGFNTAANPAEGLFSGTYTLTGELTFTPIDDLNLRFLYTRSRLNAVGGLIGAGGQSEPLYGLADDGFGGDLNDANADTYSFDFDWQPLEWLGLFGRYTYGKTHVRPVNTGLPRGVIIGQSVQAGLAFPDLGKDGSLLTVSYLIPFSIIGGRNFVVSGAGDGGIQHEFEANYFYPLNNNIALVPSFFWIKNPNNFGANPDVYVANFRAQFSF